MVKTRRFLKVPMVLLVLAVLAGVVVGGAAPASAAPTGRVIASPSLTIRTDATTAARAIGYAPYNATVAIHCTKRGSAVSGPYGTSTLWNRISYGGLTGFVADAWVYTGTNNAVAGACTTAAPPPPPAPATSVKAQRAVDWARAQLGRGGWDGWCDRFVANAYGRANSGYHTAYQHYQDMARRGLIRTTGTPPLGALVFYGPARVNGNAGHVQISEGNGNYITTAPTVRRVSISWPGAPYLGWSHANPEWPGR